MSILFPKLPKPRQWDYRPIYYDEEKERRKERLRQLQEERRAAEGKQGDAAPEGGRQHTLHRGSFREAADRNQSARVRQNRQANIRVFVLVLAMLLLLWWFLS